jgi:MFS family permease
MVVLDFFIVNVALPSMQSDLHASASAMQWVVAGYALTSAVFLITAARLGDRIGSRRVFSLGLALFTLSSAACGVAASPALLVIAHLRRDWIEPARDVLAMALGHRQGTFARGGLALAHQGREAIHDLLGLGVDLRPLGLAVAGGPARRLLVGVGVAPALACLFVVLGGIEVLEHARYLHFSSLFECRESLVERSRRRAEALKLEVHQLSLLSQRGCSIMLGVIEQLLDFL